jgi:prophage regulatory protein
MQKSPHQAAPALLRTKAVCQQLSISRSGLRGLIQQGKFPPPLKVGVRAVAWRAADIAQFIAALSPIR